MSRVYVSTTEDNGTLKYALFDNSSDPHRILQVDWKPLIFESEAEATAKLEQLEAEKVREDNAVPFSLEDAKKYAESHYWKFASTYAKTAPHEYMVKRWLVKEDQLLYERFVATMKSNFVVGYFYRHENNYFILGDHYYWYMPSPDNIAVDLINRTTVDYLEFKDGAYYYKPNSLLCN